MKKIEIFKSFLAAMAVTILSTGCSEEDIPGGFTNPDAKGKDVNFSLTTNDVSRTYYDPEGWGDNLSATSIFWGTSPTDPGTEEVIVYGEYEGRNVGHYSVGGVDLTNKSHATTLTKKGDVGVQWGEATTEKVHFYSVYPAFDGKYKDAQLQPGWLRTELTPGQSPKSFLVDGQYASLTTVQSIGTTTRTIIANPDMTAGVMVANTEADYGATQVGLTYNMIPNVVEFTINGPTKALLNGLEVNYVDILNVKIASKGLTTPIAGVFDYKAETGDIQMVNNVATIQIALGEQFQNDKGVTQVAYPRLYNRSEGNTDNPSMIDQLKVRAFLLPDVDPKNLEIYIETSQGYYQLNPTSVSSLPAFQKGKIHRIKLPLLDNEGRHSFDYSKWMEQIDPNIYITELSIPGSWGSFTNTQNTFQSINYEQQYAAGIRAFTMKLNGSTTLVDQFNSSVTLANVLETLGGKISGSKEYVVLVLRTAGQSQQQMNAIRTVLTASKYVYGNVSGESITPNTTVGDVAGKIIVKLNMDGDNMPSTPATIQALMSKWESGSEDKAVTVPLDWSTWNNTGSAGNTGLKWCFIETERAYTGTNTDVWSSTLKEKKDAIKNLIEVSQTTYDQGSHNTWFYLVAGGFLDNADATTTSCRNLATEINQYTYNLLSDNARQACPMGLVMMNCVAPAGTSDVDDTYFSARLIRTIIANNNAFIMAKKGASPATNDVTFRNQGNLTR